jgi:hypothetical protein
MKICGSGWGVCELEFTRGVDVSAIAAFVNERIFD